MARHERRRNRPRSRGRKPAEKDAAGRKLPGQKIVLRRVRLQTAPSGPVVQDVYALGNKVLKQGDDLELFLPVNGLPCGSLIGKFEWSGKINEPPGLAVESWVAAVAARHPATARFVNLGGLQGDGSVVGGGFIPLEVGARMQRVSAEVANSRPLKQIRANWPLIASGAWDFFLKEGRGAMLLWDEDLRGEGLWLPTEEAPVEWLPALSIRVGYRRQAELNNQNSDSTLQEAVRNYNPERDVVVVLIRAAEVPLETLVIAYPVEPSYRVIQCWSAHPYPPDAHRLVNSRPGARDFLLRKMLHPFLPRLLPHLRNPPSMRPW